MTNEKKDSTILYFEMYQDYVKGLEEAFRDTLKEVLNDQLKQGGEINDTNNTKKRS